jgi:hypothetical protein
MITNHLHYLKCFFSNSLIMKLFVDTSTRLLCHMNPINIIMETYMQVSQKTLKINN